MTMNQWIASAKGTMPLHEFYKVCWAKYYGRECRSDDKRFNEDVLEHAETMAHPYYVVKLYERQKGVIRSA